ncbi:MAG: insulinase family protein [candidate division WOR-3 bacterium]|nr:MAG: insulinase family protein [candidate division WOR-3 bacterium]
MIQLLCILIAFSPIDVAEYELSNGLKVFIYEDHFAPVVSTQIYYRVGSYNELRGYTGISHFLEHMSFKSTKNYKTKDYDRRIEEMGGEENGFTSLHRTGYFANLHKDRYEFELEFEAERMTNLLVDPEEFESEKGVVMEERRLWHNDPHRYFFEQLDLVSYTNHPYRISIVGFMEDLERTTRDDVYDWYRTFYNPANAVIIIAGSIEADDALRKVKKHFAGIPGKKVDEMVFTETPQEGERRFELRRDVRTPVVGIQYHTVPAGSPEECALDVIAMILTYGVSSRFETDLVRKQGLATEVRVYHNTSKYGGTFIVYAVPQEGIEPVILEQALLKEMERLKSEPVTDSELQKAKNQVLAQAVYGRDAPTRVGYMLGWWEIEGNGWQNINQYPVSVQEVTKDDIMNMAQKYFLKNNRTVGYLLPVEEQ